MLYSTNESQWITTFVILVNVYGTKNDLCGKLKYENVVIRWISELSMKISSHGFFISKLIYLTNSK